MQELCAELSELRRCFGEWASLPGSQRSGPPALGLTEGPLREFFSRVSPDGVKAGSGHRPALDPRFSSDLDIVFDRDGDGWFSHFRLKVDASPVLAHLDVSSRTRWDPSKLYEDLTRLQRTIDDARALGTKTWTGLLAVGSGFRGHTAELMQLLHEFCHDRQLESWQWTAGDVWPFVDAVIVPGMLLKKHDLFDEPERSSRRWPVLYPFPVGDYCGLGDLWPLVTARAFLASYLRKALGLESWDAPAWEDSENDEVLGGSSLEEPWRRE